MEIVVDSINRIDHTSRLTVRYQMWKQSLHKWNQYVDNRHRATKNIDWWCKKIVEESVGYTVAYNCGGLFFKHFLPDIAVIEHFPCPINVSEMQYLSQGHTFSNQVDSLIMINPISIKYHHSLKDVFTKPGISRAGYKPALTPWLKSNAKIFLSFSDWHMYFDRLKYSVDDFVTQQLSELQQIGITCQYQKIEKSTADPINGNIKLVLSYN
jgi:hypothetical protein